MDKGKIMMYLLKIRGYIINVSHSVYIKITDTKSIHIINEDTMEEIYANYVIFKMLHNIIKLLKKKEKIVVWARGMGTAVAIELAIDCNTSQV